MFLLMIHISFECNNEEMHCDLETSFRCDSIVFSVFSDCISTVKNGTESRESAIHRQVSQSFHFCDVWPVEKWNFILNSSVFLMTALNPARRLMPSLNQSSVRQRPVTPTKKQKTRNPTKTPWIRFTPTCWTASLVRCVFVYIILSSFTWSHHSPLF